MAIYCVALGAGTSHPTRMDAASNPASSIAAVLLALTAMSATTNMGAVTMLGSVSACRESAVVYHSVIFGLSA